MSRETKAGSTLRQWKRFHCTHIKCSEDFSSLFLTEESAIPGQTKAHDKTDNLIFNEQIKQYLKRCFTLKGNLAATWSVAIGHQCTETSMKAKLVSVKEYDNKQQQESDCNWLLKIILSITLQFDNRRYGRPPRRHAGSTPKIFELQTAVKVSTAANSRSAGPTPLSIMADQLWKTIC